MYVDVNGVSLFYERFRKDSEPNPDMGADEYPDGKADESFGGKTDARPDGRADESSRSIVLLHGNGEDHHIFDELAQELRLGWTVYALDSRGHGASSPVESLSYDDMADDVIAFIEALGLQRPALLGFSDGGIIGLIVAMRAPSLLSCMAVCGANTIPQGVKPRFLATFRLMWFFGRDLRIRMMLDEPRIAWDELAEIRIPVLVMAGSKDLIREEHTRHIAAAIPRSRLVILEGEGHSSYVKHSLKVLEVLGPFLAGKAHGADGRDAGDTCGAGGWDVGETCDAGGRGAGPEGPA